MLRFSRVGVLLAVCLVAGFLGVVLVVATSGSTQATGTTLGYFLMIGVAFSFGAGAVYARWAKPNSPALIASGQLIVASLVAVFASVLVGESWQLDWSVDVVFSVLMLGAFCTALPAVLFLMVISRYKAVKVGAASFLQPIWAIILGAIFLAEWISILQLLGSAIIVLSVVAITTQTEISKRRAPKHNT